MSSIRNIPGEKLAVLATSTAIAISEEFDIEDVNILASFFSAIGDTLGIIAAQEQAARSE